ncbi:hypothetical protein BC834DRAFT_891115 [Gloeopeniophorella convolvens]|nr:hypothetical protein BC834DRAFT_891115 [Gloeopeniophorella convolvens]
MHWAGLNRPRALHSISPTALSCDVGRQRKTLKRHRGLSCVHRRLSLSCSYHFILGAGWSPLSTPAASLAIEQPRVTILCGGTLTLSAPETPLASLTELDKSMERCSVASHGPHLLDLPESSSFKLQGLGHACPIHAPADPPSYHFDGTGPRTVHITMLFVQRDGFVDET